MLSKLKHSIGISDTCTDFDVQLQDLLDEADIDLRMDGLNPPSVDDTYWQGACITYAKSKFRSPENYDQLVRAYETMKSQMHTSSRYTDWGDS